MDENATTEREDVESELRQGLGAAITQLLDEHWPNSGVNGWYLTDLLAPLLAARERAARAEALRAEADRLDDHTDCECEPGDHLTRLIGAKGLRDRAASYADQSGRDDAGGGGA